MNKNALKYTLVSLLTAAPFFFLSATVGFVVLGLALAYSISKPGMSKRLNALFFAGFVATMIAGTGWIGGVALGLIGLLCSRMFVAAEGMSPVEVDEDEMDRMLQAQWDDMNAMSLAQAQPHTYMNHYSPMFMKPEVE